jgi:hypothetical protein
MMPVTPVLLLKSPDNSATVNLQQRHKSSSQPYGRQEIQGDVVVSGLVSSPMCVRS